MFLYWSKPLSDPAECGLIGTTKKVSGGKKSEQQKKKVSGGKKSERLTKSRLKIERRDTCLLRKRREELDVPLKAP